MAVTDESLRRVDSHWAVVAVGEQRRDRALEVADARLVRSAVGTQMVLDFADRAEDSDLLHRLALAYEMAAIEGLGAVLHPASEKEAEVLRDQCYAGAWRAFELARLFDIPEQNEERILHILHLAALAYCADRWVDLRRWLTAHEEQITVPIIEGLSWDRRVLFRVYECWIRLFRKRDWNDLHRVLEIVTELRADQSTYEADALSEDGQNANRTMALRLVALYHWAKATELLAEYMAQGTPVAIAEELDKHFEMSTKAASAAGDAPLEVLQRWLHVAARRMASGSLWWVARAVNSRVTRFVRNATHSQSMFELLPPQRAALQEQGLLDQAHRAVIVEMPTSGGKTLLAEFRMLQALNQYDQEKGWVAYVAPTRALVAQLTRRLRRDFEPFGLKVEALSGAIEIDAFEEAMLSTINGQNTFDVLVSTPEKLQLVIRNRKVLRPLALIVMDEAQNIEDEERGLRIELLLATIRRECETASFLLLMPYVPNAQDLANWLAPEAGKAISIGTSAWRPNERIIGLYQSQRGEAAGDWTLCYETLVTTPKALRLKGRHQVGGVRPLGVSWSKSRSLIAQTAAMARVFSERGTSVAVASKIPDVWSMARSLAMEFSPYANVPDEIALVQRFLETEISPDFELINLLSRGIAVHHAGLSDETRSLIEWLAEENKLRILCATTTISQGINFPVSSVFLSSINHPMSHPPYQQRMSAREFWNLAGRAGRIDHDSVGVVGVAAGPQPESLKSYLSQATGELISRLASLLDEIDEKGRLGDLTALINGDQWQDFRSYVAHLWAEKQNLDEVLAATEQLLRSTFGYVSLRSKQTEQAKARADALLDTTRHYVRQLAQHPENATLVDSTGFTPEGVRAALSGLDQLEHKLTPAEWEPSRLFGPNSGSILPDLIGVMLHVPELQASLKELSPAGLDRDRIAALASAWVNGVTIRDIAETFFRGTGNLTDAITAACRAIYRDLANSGPWGLSALSKMPTSGLDFNQMSDEAKRTLNLLPSMVYHGVRTEAAVLMRMNLVPRSVAEPLAERFRTNVGDGEQTVRSAREFLSSLSDADWNTVVPPNSTMTGEDYRAVWQMLSGETR